MWPFLWPLFKKQIDIGRLLPAFPVTPPCVRVRTRRIRELSYKQIRPTLPSVTSAIQGPENLNAMTPLEHVQGIISLKENRPALFVDRTTLSFFALQISAKAHPVLDVVINDEVQLFVRKTVMLGQYTIDCVNDGL